MQPMPEEVKQQEVKKEEPKKKGPLDKIKEKVEDSEEHLAILSTLFVWVFWFGLVVFLLLTM